MVWYSFVMSSSGDALFRRVELGVAMAGLSWVKCCIGKVELRCET